MNTINHKSEKIHNFLSKAKGKINLHQIKAETGAGNGFKHSNSSFIPNIVLSDEAIQHKSERIHHFITSSTEKINLHHIKSQTGAGNGFKDSASNTKYEPIENNFTDESNFTHKSEKINDAVNNTEGKVNLHDIKAKTGAGSGFKHH